MNDRITAYVLAGGASSRFPSDKARVEVLGQPQIVRLRQQLVDAGHEVNFVADRFDRYLDLGLTCIADLDPGCGPLGGLITALNDYQQRISEGWILLVSCDQLQWQACWSFCSNQLELMARDWVAAKCTGDFECKPSLNDSDQASAILWPSETFSPLPGYYHTRLLSELKAAWLSGKRALKVIQDLQVRYLPGATHPSVFSFNSPQQLQELLRHIDDRP